MQDLGLPDYFGASTVAMKGVWVEGTQKAQAVGAGGVYTLGGTTWTQEAPTQGIDLRGIWGLGAGSTIVAVGPSQVCSRSIPTGWSCSGLGGNALHAIWGTGSQLFAVGHQRISVGALFGVGQVSWSNDLMLAQPGELNAVWGRSATEVYAVGEEGVIRRRGSPPSWTAEESGTNRTLHGVYLPPAGLASVCEVWAVGALGM